MRKLLPVDVRNAPHKHNFTSDTQQSRSKCRKFKLDSVLSLRQGLT